MTLSTEIQQHSQCPGVPAADRVHLWAGAAYSAVAKEDAAVTIRIVDEDEGSALNRDFRGRPGAANVLSFSYSAGPFVQRGLLGDIVICAPVVEREALSQSKAMEAHWAHMVVHGVLHLCGYDHADAADARKMERLEIEILSNLGFQSPYN